jgi:DNA transformation protein and related proteins
MPYNNDYLQYVLEQLAGLRGVVSRRMFGGAGLYQDELFFGLIASDTLYFRVNDENRADYEAHGMSRFRPYEDKPHLSFNYYEVPAHVLEDAEQLVAWARRSVSAADTAAREAKPSKRKWPKALGSAQKQPRPKKPPSKQPARKP